MELLLNEIERALDSGLYYLALQSSLTLPDICAALMSPNGKSKRDKYIKWYNTYARESDNNALSGEDCYYFRCSCVHQGSTLHDSSSYSRIVFTLPEEHNIITHNNIIYGALNIDVNIFCRNMLSAVRQWESHVKNNPVFVSNYAQLMKLYPNGYPGYITGLPVIT